MNISKFLKIAIEESKKSNHRQRCAAVIFKRNKIISKGFNTTQKSIKHFKKKFQRWPGTIHAEVDAIIKAKTDLKRCSILVVRINRNGQLRLSKPCQYCQMYLDYIGIRKIYYTTNDATIQELNEKSI
ncbi:MAG: hypothetical protein PHD05_00395 [Sphaerochaetaceae bacterium]|jgi:deoxycytidylate deaminase|nr:hypothetical protein [Sphaerochaetaceae bacterium]